jgi:two-component system, NtrC family, sensor kinase
VATGRTTREKTKRRSTRKPPRRVAPAVRPTSEKKKIALLSRQLCDALEGQAATARELSEAREQQAASSEILHVIGESHANVQPVFETLARNAVRLCRAEHASIWLYDGRSLKVVVTHNVSAERRTVIEQNPILRDAVTGQHRMIHVAGTSYDQ